MILYFKKLPSIFNLLAVFLLLSCSTETRKEESTQVLPVITPKQVLILHDMAMDKISCITATGKIDIKTINNSATLTFELAYNDRLKIFRLNFFGPFWKSLGNLFFENNQFSFYNQDEKFLYKNPEAAKAIEAILGTKVNLSNLFCILFQKNCSFTQNFNHTSYNPSTRQYTFLGEGEEFFFDSLYRLIKYRINFTGDPAYTESSYSDFKTIDGIQFPHNIFSNLSSGGKNTVLKIVFDDVDFKQCPTEKILDLLNKLSLQK